MPFEELAFATWQAGSSGHRFDASGIVSRLTMSMTLCASTLAIAVWVSAYAQASQAVASSASEKPDSHPAATNYDPLLDPPPLPQNRVTLIGGTVADIDPVMNRITIRPFGDKQKMRVAFDTRTQILADGRPGAESTLQKGQRVYLDTMLNGTTVFAKTIQIDAHGGAGSGRGQIVAYDPGSGELTLRDELSDQATRFHLSPTTVVRSDGQTRTTADLVPGSLVSLTFGAQQNRDVVQEVSLLAKPGSTFSFFGPITYVDLSRKLLALNNRNDDKNYEIHLTAIPRTMLHDLHEGTVVGISAEFDGSQYVARDLKFPQEKQQQ
jgi:hypothetical protein